MKKILITLIGLVICIGLLAQTKTVDGRLEPLTSGQEDLDKVTTDNADDISTLQTNTSGVAGWTIALNATSDSMVFTLGSAVYKIKIADTQEDDVTPPTVLSAEVGNVEDSIIYLTMSETVTNLVATTAWTVTENGVAFGLDAMQITGGDTIKIFLDSAVASQSNVLMSYTRPGAETDIQDASANFLGGFSDVAVTNNVVTQNIPPIAAYHFENTLVDSSGNDYTLTSSVATFGVVKVEGTYGATIDAVDAYFGMPEVDLEEKHTISLWATIYGAANTRTLYSTLTGNDGLEIQLDFVNTRIIVTTGNGTSTSTAYSSSSLGWTGGGTFHHIAVVFDRTSGACDIYFDGADVTSVNGIRTDYDNSAPGRFGLDWSNNNDLFGYMDFAMFWPAAASAADVLNMYNNPGVRFNITSSGDIPVPSDSIDVLWSQDWADFAVQTTIPEDTLAAHIDNFDNLDSDDGDGIANFADIVAVNGRNWLKSWYLKDHCCTEGQNLSFSSGGSGIDGKAYITNSTTWYPEVYFSYEMVWDANSGDFVNSSGHKIPGLMDWKGSTSTGAMALGMILGTSQNTLTDLSPAYYLHHWERGFDNPIVYASQTKTGDWIMSGDTIVLTWRCVYGDDNTGNGFMELFIDGIFIGGDGYAPWPGAAAKNLYFNHPDNNSTGWSYINISTFMGGGTVDYLSPKDQFTLLGLMKIWKYGDNVTGIPKYTDSNPYSGPLRDIKGVLRSLGYNL